MTIVPVKRALLSVSDKTGIVEFAQQLIKLQIEIISTGGTSKLLTDNQIPHIPVEDVTGLAEMLDGRVKTLHPKIHGGILGRRDVHAAEMAQHEIPGIDLVVVNFYPFAHALQQNEKMTWDEAVEYIDIGGPTMVRAAAKNFTWVGVITEPLDYTKVLNELQQSQGLTFETRKHLAQKVFALTSAYDGMISHYFLSQEKPNAECPPYLELQLQKMTELRYGENPHQKASAYQYTQDKTGILSAQQHQGKPLSYNNILDAEAAWSCVNEFTEPACVIVKHANPCGAATAHSIEEAYQHAYEADTQSAFGGIVALNRSCTKRIAEAMAHVFTEVVIAPSFTEDALTIFMNKPNLRVLSMPKKSSTAWEMKFISGGVLMQERDHQVIDLNELKVVTSLVPQPAEMDAMLFAWRVLKHIKSNAILIAKDNMTLGIGAGQVSRLDAVDIAVRKTGEVQDTVLASDAFFPFRDSIDRIAQTGVKAIIQPGGSVRDEEVIAACNEHHIAMVFTGKRCFKH